MNEYKKKIGAYYYLYNDFTNYLVQNVPYQVLEISKAEDFQKAIKYAKRKGIEKIAIACNPSKEDLLLLAELPLKGIAIREVAPKTDLSFLNQITTLTYISIEFTASGVLDLANFPHLEVLNVVAGIKLLHINKTIHLKEIFLREFKEPFDSWGTINVDIIEFYACTITSFDFLKNCTGIKTLEVENSRKLTSISGLKNAGTIERLYLKNCKYLTDYSAFPDFTNLKYLYLLNCGAMENCKLFEGMQQLEYAYIDIDIVDGNVDILMQKPVIFKNYKHFNHKNNLRLVGSAYDKPYNELYRGKELAYKF